MSPGGLPAGIPGQEYADQPPRQPLNFGALYPSPCIILRFTPACRLQAAGMGSITSMPDNAMGFASGRQQFHEVGVELTAVFVGAGRVLGGFVYISSALNAG